MSKLYNLARMTTATAGTGTITLGAAVSGYLTFALAGVANGDTVSYGIKDGANSEVGTGTYTASGTTLTRNVTRSTNSNSAISLSGTAEVFITPRAEDLTPVAGLLFGLTLSTVGASAIFGIAAGRAVDSTITDLMMLGAALTKTTGAWAVGSGTGSLDTGSIAASTWYHAYLIKRLDTGVVDVLISLSATSPALPTNYGVFRRIGSMKTDGSGLWTKFVQLGDEFLWDSTVGLSLGTGSTSVALATMAVPTGVQVNVLFAAEINTSATMASTFWSPDVSAGSGVDIVGFNGTLSGGTYNKRTNTSGQIKYVSSSSGGVLTVWTIGWVDRRGRDG
jgi:hypothetical protein